MLSIKGTEVKLIDTIGMGDSDRGARVHSRRQTRLGGQISRAQGVAARGRRRQGHLREADLPTGLWPFNVAVAPSGKIAFDRR